MRLRGRGPGLERDRRVRVTHRGKVFYDAGDFVSARADFKRALFLRQESGATDDQLEAALLAIDAADRRRTGAPVAS